MGVLQHVVNGVNGHFHVIEMCTRNVKLVPQPGRKAWRNGFGLLPLNRKLRARIIGRMPVLPHGMILPLQSKSLL